MISCFCFNVSSTTDIYTLSLHDALPIYFRDIGRMVLAAEGRKANDSHADCYQYFCVPEYGTANGRRRVKDRKSGSAGMPRPISYAVFCLKKKKQVIST